LRVRALIRYVAPSIWKALAKFGGLGQSGLGGRSGGDANIEEFTERRWLTVNTEPAHYPY
jgi:benzaldehyde dehydrogenase (NAD)